MLSSYIGGMVVTMSGAFGLVWLVMWAANRWVHLYVALAVGAVAVLALFANLVQGVVHCSEPPTIMPPDPGTDGEGRLVANCDGAGGVIDRIYLYVLGPILGVALIWLTWRFWAASLAATRPVD